MGLKVLCITPWFPIHPQDKRSCFIWDSVEALQKLDVDTVALVTKAWQPKFTGKIHADFTYEKIDFTLFPVKIKICRYLSIPRHYFRSISNFFYISRVVTIIKKLHKLHHFDIIHAQGEIAGLAAVSASKQLKIPAVVTIHGIDTCHRMWARYAKKQFQKMFQQATRIIFVGDFLKQHFEKIIHQADNCRVVYNGFRLPTMQSKKKWGNKTELIRLISVGHLHEGKGIDLTLQALGKLKENNVENWHYKIIGSGYQKKYLENIIEQLHLESDIEFMGDCSHEVVYENLQNADVFCLPSYREAFGIAYVEAMAHGLLTIGVKGQGPQAFIDHTKTGLLVEPQDIHHLFETLHQAITHFDEMKLIAQAGQQYVLENFTWEKHAEKLLHVYREVCS